ncbi:glycosyltransferase [Cytophagaceae bacterium ABcell3]|nr:glycosyltransferase [Cytophagaceae bacterium ABcell3]
MPKYSLIIPVYNRPEEIEELLESLTHQIYKDFEVIVVEDGSSRPSENIVRSYYDKLSIKYLTKKNSGPGLSRNYGAVHAQGLFLIFLDSDCVIPKGYLRAVDEFLTETPVDCFGGPDMADPEFNVMQKAVSYAMTSFFTTGGIRGGKKRIGKFLPRSFNMGYSSKVFEATSGFSSIRYGEDIDMTLRIIKKGFKTALIPEAYVYHKRRTDLRKFFNQVYQSGKARLVLFQLHPESLKPVHFLPTAFTLGAAFLLILSLFYPVALAPLLFYLMLVLIDASIRNSSFFTGLFSVAASVTQLTGYGTGFISGCIQLISKKKKPD